jgi:MraZ protein
MYQFWDQFEHTIDDKGRMVLPAAYREAFEDGGFLVLLGKNPALFTPDGWEKYRRKLSMTGEFTRQQLQYLYASASPFMPDGQHRIVVNARVRERAGLGREVTIAGSGQFASIFPRDRWAEVETQALAPDETGRTLNDKIDDLDFL